MLALWPRLARSMFHLEWQLEWLKWTGVKGMEGHLKWKLVGSTSPGQHEHFGLLWIIIPKKRLNNPTMIEPPRNCQISGSHSEECFGSWCKHIASSLVLVSTALHLRWKPRRFILVIGRHHPEWPRGSLLLLGATSLDCCKATALSLTPAAIFCTAHKV